MENYKFKLIFIFIGFLLCLGCISSEKRLVFDSDKGKESVVVKNKLSIIELYHLYKSLELIKLIDPTQSYVGYERIPVYWMSSKKFSGLTVWNDQFELLGIFLDEDLKIKNYNDKFAYLDLGAIYSHELSHALHNTKDPYTSTITEQRTYSLIATNTNAVKLIIDWKPF